MFHMTEKTKRRSDLRFEREAEALRKNLAKSNRKPYKKNPKQRK